MGCKAYLACAVTTVVVLLIGGIALWLSMRPASSPPPIPSPPTLPPPVFASLPDLSLSSRVANDSTQAQPCDVSLDVEEEYSPNVETKQINSESILTIINSDDNQAGHQVSAIYHLISAKVVVGLVAVLAFLACLHVCFVNVLHHRTISHSRAVMAAMWGGQDPPPPSGGAHSSWGARLRTTLGLPPPTSNQTRPAAHFEGPNSLEMTDMSPTSTVPSNPSPQSGNDLASPKQLDPSSPVLDPLGAAGSVADSDRPGRVPLAGVLSDTRGIRAVLKLYLSSFTDLNHHVISLDQARVFPIGFIHHMAALILFTLTRTRGLAAAFNPAAAS